MEKDLYEVYDGNTLLASHMDIDVALILIKAYYEKYSKDNITMHMKNMERTKASE